MKRNKLVSVIVTTKNEERNIENCLSSIAKQTYSPIQIIVVDNKSTDRTKEIAKKFTQDVFDKGPERSAQRNFGAKKARGDYLFFLDSDMILKPTVVTQCVVKTQQGFGGIIIPEESFGEGFWAKAKALERSFYLGNKTIEAARFFPKKIFEEIGKFDENLTGPEDWDLSQRVAKAHKIGRINVFLLHNEGRLSLLRTIKKKYYYAKKFGPYIDKKDNKVSSSKQFNPVGRYKIFFSQPKKLFRNPFLGAGVLIMKTGEFAAGGLGYLVGKKK